MIEMVQANNALAREIIGSMDAVICETAVRLNALIGCNIVVFTLGSIAILS